MHHLTPHDRDYATCERTDISFRIYSGSVKPDRITSLLKISPDDSAEIGKPIRHARTGRERLPRSNVWLLSSEGKVISKDLRDHLDWFLNVLEPGQDGLAQLQAMPDVHMTVWCIWWSLEGGGGPVLWPEQMRRMAALNLECSFDFQYFGVDEEGPPPDKFKN